MMENKKLLLIDDDSIILETTAALLELANYDVLAASNGREGVELAKSEHPDLIICDIMMPEIDGYGVFLMLSRDPATSGTPFIFLSAMADQSDVRRGMTTGVDDYITKPFKEVDLLNAIEGRLKRSDVLKQEFAYARDGVGHFIDSVHEISSLNGLYKNREPRRYEKKHVIYYEGEEPNYLFFLEKGKVRTFKVHADGKEYAMSLVNAGEFFGANSIMENTRYMDSAEAMSESKICRIPRRDFEQLLSHDHEVGTAFIKLLSKSFHEQEEKLLSQAYDTVLKRTSNAILELKDKFGKEPEIPFLIDISRQDLASMVGTSSESISRSLAEFKSEGFISVDEHSRIHILNEEGLRKVC
jgi:CRP-like cAMP-binding protein/CheY-like chemotaxis protein